MMSTSEALGDARTVILGMVAVVLTACSLTAASPTAAPSMATPTASVSPSPDAQVVQYRHLIDVDVNAINFALYRLPCNSRQTCTAQLKQVETATEALLSDLTNAVVPSGVGPTVEPLKSAAQQFEEQVDDDLVAVQQPNSNYTAASPMVGDLFLATATFDCWPSKPVNYGGEGGYSCS